MMRQCGTCTLCCKLLPVRELDKDAGVRCKFQKFHKGCTVYGQPEMPPACSLWNCRWLINDDCDDIPRPDRAHYVIDIMPDYITGVDDATDQRHNWPVVQIWCDPNYPDAWKTEPLRAWMSRQAEKGNATIVRYGQKDGIVIFPPPISQDGQWHTITPTMRENTHTATDIQRVLGPLKIGMMDE